MARNSGCCRRAKSALTRDCSPVRLPNWVEGYLPRQEKTCHRKCHSQAFQMSLAQVHWCPQATPLAPEKRQGQPQRTAGCLPSDYYLLSSSAK